jgi:hypothetical protein
MDAHPLLQQIRALLDADTRQRQLQALGEPGASV